MLNKGELYIKDTCILIDLIELDLIDIFYNNLNLKIITTNFVISEITDSKQKVILERLISKDLVLVDCQGKFEDINSLYQLCAGLSFTDCSVIELAMRKAGYILSADGKLRKYAKENSIRVKGALWIIEEFLNNKILTKENAIGKLKEYLEINDRAPKKEIFALIMKLSKTMVSINS